MKSVKLTGIRRMEIIETQEPAITDVHDVKIKMITIGICGSDIHYYTQGAIGSQVVQYPFTVGHECAGVVTAVGKSVTRVKEGDIIAIDPAMPCFECDQCRAGRHHTCRKLKFLGCPGQAEGCLSEYIVMPEESCFPMTGSLTADDGAISEPLAIGVYAVKQSGGLKGLNIGILGFGPIGLSVLLASRTQETGKIYVTDKLEPRLEIAMKQGSAAIFNPDKNNIRKEILGREPAGLDVVFECCGQQEAFDEAIDILKPGGKLVVIGIPEFDRWSMDVDNTRRKEITIQFIRRQVGCVEPALNLLNSGIASSNSFITHRFPFEKTAEAFDMVAGYRDGVMKAMIDF
jgi:L-iditol 2-dehydrogenase